MEKIQDQFQKIVLWSCLLPKEIFDDCKMLVILKLTASKLENCDKPQAMKWRFAHSNKEHLMKRNLMLRLTDRIWLDFLSLER